VPLHPGNPFTQALILNIRLRPFGNYQLNAGTYVAPDGRTRYTAYGSNFLYRNQPNSSSTFTFPKFAIQGQIIDENDNPVRGAALRINRDVLFTDSNGAFLVRTRQRKQCTLEVLLDQFLALDTFEVVFAPKDCKPSPENTPDPLTIIVRRAKLRARVP
jgi:hypothetical protein